MNKDNRYQVFKELHVPGDPVVLYNVWDSGGAKALTEVGAKAIATSSWAVAAAHGYSDGEKIPIELALMIIERIVQSTDLPVSMDFEGAYADSPQEVAKHVERVIETGAIGINFEDQIVDGFGLYSIRDQVGRIEAIRTATDNRKVAFFINARTDVFLKAGEGADHAMLMQDALERRDAYAKAGANGFFVPGLTNVELIREICANSPIPVNVMMTGELKSVSGAAQLGVSRVSFGPKPYMRAIDKLAEEFNAIREDC